MHNEAAKVTTTASVLLSLEYRFGKTTLNRIIAQPLHTGAEHGL